MASVEISTSTLRGSVSSLLHCGPPAAVERAKAVCPPRERQLPPPLRQHLAEDVRRQFAGCSAPRERQLPPPLRREMIGRQRDQIELLRGSVSSLLHCGRVRFDPGNVHRHRRSEGASAPSSIAARDTEWAGSGLLRRLRGSVSSLLHCGVRVGGDVQSTDAGSEGASAPSSIAATTGSDSSTSTSHLRGSVSSLLHCGGGAAGSVHSDHCQLRGSVSSLLHCGIYHGEICIDKDPLRGSVSSLLHCGFQGSLSPSNPGVMLRGSVSSLLHCGGLTPFPVEVPGLYSEGASAPSSIAAWEAVEVVRRFAVGLRGSVSSLLHCGLRYQGVRADVDRCLRGSVSSLLHCGRVVRAWCPAD